MFAIEEMSFYEVTDHLIFPGHAEFVTTLAANPDWLESLPSERRRLIEDIVDTLQTEIYEVQSALAEERLEAIRARRPEMQIVTLDAEERAAFRARAEPVRERYVEMAGPRGQRLLQLIEAAVRRADGAFPADDSVAQ